MPSLMDEEAVGPLDDRSPGSAIALLVVDMTLGFTDDRSPLRCNVDSAIESIARLLINARTCQIPVAFTRVSYTSDVSPGGQRFRARVPQLHLLAEGSKWSLIDPRVSPMGGEPVFRKEVPSAFWGTDLDSWCTAERIGTLIVTGASTSGCIRASVIDAMQRGLRVMVPRDAVADRDSGAHSQTLTDIAWRYAEVIGEADAIHLMQAQCSGHAQVADDSVDLEIREM